MAGDGSRGARPAVLAVDGGNSKVDAVLIGRAGGVLGAGRQGRASSGDGTEPLSEAIRAACSDAGRPADGRPVAPVGVFCMAGADFPVDERRIARALAAGRWADRAVVHNDTFAVLRAGSHRGWGVAVVCGAGMNCLGLGRDGRHVRFPAFGPLSGDLAAGGEWVGLAALGAAIRARDGRGPRTALERAVAEHFGAARPETVMQAMYRGRISQRRLMELPPAVFDAAVSGDEVARAILDRLADEVVTMATATVRRLRAQREEVEVVLGGGVFRARDPAFLARIEAGVRAVAARAVVRVLRAPPVLGAALMGLDEIGASARAQSRLETELGEARLRSGHKMIRQGGSPAQRSAADQAAGLPRRRRPAESATPTIEGG